VLDDTVRVLDEWRRTERVLTGSVDLALLPAMTDMRAQVGRLVTRGFVADAGADRLRQLPRYLAAVRVRHDKLATGLARDRQLMDQIAPLQEAYLHRVAALPDGQPRPVALTEVRWLLEEYRVSLWAQQLGTPHPVSDTRIRKALDKS
jgi:ATP-dependent helicase HrpA